MILHIGTKMTSYTEPLLNSITKLEIKTQCVLYQHYLVPAYRVKMSDSTQIITLYLQLYLYYSYEHYIIKYKGVTVNEDNLKISLIY